MEASWNPKVCDNTIAVILLWPASTQSNARGRSTNSFAGNGRTPESVINYGDTPDTTLLERAVQRSEDPG